mgnify:CR=1 FL=1
MKTISAKEFKKQYGEATLAQFEKPTEEPGYFQRVGEQIKQTFTGLKSDIAKQNEVITGQVDEPPIKTGFKKTIAAMRGGLRIGGAVAKTALTPVMEAPIVKPATEFVGEKLAETTPMKKFQEWATRHPEAAKDIMNVVDVAGLFGVKAATAPLARGATNVTKKAVQVAGDVVKASAKATTRAGEATRGAIIPIVEEAKRIPARLQTNIAQKQAVQETISRLPSKVAREAAQDGIEAGDIRTIYNITKEQKAPLKKLANVVKEFSEGKTKTNPIEVVGKPIITRLKELESARTKVGAKLGNVSKKLGIITTQETTPVILKRLQKVPGLERLTTNKNGLLDFKNTVLTTIETASDRKALQNAFNAATKRGKGERKHLLRQELFEILGGKKRSRLNLTDTQEKGLDAIRKGLSDVLESKSKGYKSLSNQYRQIITPLKEMRKVMRVVGEEEDILNMSAGLLARRLTSAATSNPQIKAILNAMDKATKVSGKTRLSVETLQDFYNILEKYYDIAPKTGFQAQVKQGVEKAVGGPLNYIAKQFESYIGETPAVRQRALERIIEEVLK